VFGCVGHALAGHEWVAASLGLYSVVVGLQDIGDGVYGEQEEALCAWCATKSDQIGRIFTQWVIAYFGRFF
jgi:hypothetical protein